MAIFERSRKRISKKDFRASSSRRSSRDNIDFDKKPKRFSRNRRDFEMTKVICASCGDECEVPFKPTSSKPVYCNNCFSKTGKGNSNKPSDRDIDIINEKLNKIMKALDIE